MEKLNTLFLEKLWILGFGTETIERLLEKLINDFSDIYKLNLNDLINLERMAKKSAENLISAIEKSKYQPFEKVLFGLGIRYVGETVSKNNFKNFRYW